jgi:hypothetical protein
MSELQFHPLANIFPLMEGEEFDAFVADIARHGQHARIVLKDGMILEGRNRYRACRKLGIEPSFACKEYSDQITDPAAYVISANIRRRHLSAEDREKYLMQVIAAAPEKSDRTLAKETGLSHPTIAKARKQAETTGKALPVEKRTGADGKARKQPVKPTAATRAVRKEAGKKAAATKRATRKAELDRAQEKRDRVIEVLIRHIGRENAIAVYRAAAAVGGPSLYFELGNIFEDVVFDLDDEFDDFMSKYGKPERAITPVEGARPVENAPPPDVGADNMRAAIAAAPDDDRIPESLRRGPKTAG